MNDFRTLFHASVVADLVPVGVLYYPRSDERRIRSRLAEIVAA